MAQGVHEAVTSHLPSIAVLCRQYGVERLDVFGSAARGIDFDPSRSDVDLLVRFLGETVVHHRAAVTYSHGVAQENLRKALEQLLGRHVDLIREGSIRNPYILRTVEEDRVTLYEA